MLKQLRNFAAELSRTFPQVALRLIIIAALFCKLFVLSPFAHAATQILLDEGYEIRFDSGKFDAKTLNMRVINLEVYKNDKRYWNANALSLETILLADGRTLIVKNLEIDSFVSFIGKLAIGSIIVRNVTLDKYDHLLAGEIGSLLEHALDNAYLGMFDFWVPIESSGEYDTFIQSVELTPVQRFTSPSGSSYFNRIGMRGVASVRHQRLHSPNEVLKTENIGKDDFVTQLSLQSLEIAFDIENALIEDGGFMRSELSGQVDIKNHFRTDIEFDAKISLPAFLGFFRDKDLNTVLNGEFGDDFAQSFFLRVLQSDASLLKANVSIRDYGTFDRLLNLHAKNSGQSADAALEDIRLKIEQGIRENIPNEGPRLLPAIDEFLNGRGQLRISVAPDVPVPFLLFASYLLTPEKAIKQLNVTTKKMN